MPDASHHKKEFPHNQKENYREYLHRHGYLKINLHRFQASFFAPDKPLGFFPNWALAIPGSGLHLQHWFEDVPGHSRLDSYWLQHTRYNTEVILLTRNHLHPKA